MRKDLYFSQFDKKGISNYAFPVILNTNKLKSRNDFEKYLLKNKIEFRRGNAGGGNQLRQPYLQKILKKILIWQILESRESSSFRILYWKLSKSYKKKN